MDVPDQPPLCLNLGAGRRVMEGFLSVDVAGEPDIKADVRCIPLESETVDEAVAIHVLEHLPRWEAPKALAEWFRILKPGGRLAVEVPDLIKCCQAVIDGERDRAGLWGLFGSPEYEDELMVHKWCWKAEELVEELRKAGFSHIRVKAPQFHKKYRDMRIEAIK